MRILRFKTSKAHGYLDLDISFKPSLTFLTGINGSGKTTTVRSIVALLSPTFRELARSRYERLQVDVSHNDRSVTVASWRTEDDVSLSVSGVNDVLIVPIFKPQGYESPGRFLERESEFYREQHTMLSKHPVIEAIGTLPTPMFLDLERRGGDGIRRPRYVSARELAGPYGMPLFDGSLGEGLREAQDLAEEANQRFMAQRQELTDDLRKGLILMTFATDDSPALMATMPRADDVARIATSHEVVAKTLRQSLGITQREIERQVEPFFAKLGDVVTKLVGRNLEDALKNNEPDAEGVVAITEYFSLVPQERQIRRMVKRAEQYNHQVNQAYGTVGTYLDVVNTFLRDSRKTVAFSREGRLRVMSDGKDLGNLSALSSGERQVVVILTHLAFNARVREANVLIIDEPELSLHIHWQEEFVDAVAKASPGIQLILATHSPSIIMDRIEACVDLGASR